jgi:hypothetical protein
MIQLTVGVKAHLDSSPSDCLGWLLRFSLCKHVRLHAALGYLEPRELHFGNPEQRRQQRREKLDRAGRTEEPKTAAKWPPNRAQSLQS